MSNYITGATTALITPFKNGTLDEATFATLIKRQIAHGIDDSTVTTFASTAIGSRIPIIIVPAMHISMYDHNIFQNNIKKLKINGIKFITLEDLVKDLKNAKLKLN